MKARERFSYKLIFDNRTALERSEERLRANGVVPVTIELRGARDNLVILSQTFYVAAEQVRGEIQKAKEQEQTQIATGVAAGTSTASALAAERPVYAEQPKPKQQRHSSATSRRSAPMGGSTTRRSRPVTNAG